MRRSLARVLRYAALVAIGVFVFACSHEATTGIVCVVRISGGGYLSADSPTRVTDVSVQVYGKSSGSNSAWEQSAFYGKTVEPGSLPFVFGLYPRGAQIDRLWMTVVTIVHNGEDLERKIAIGSFGRDRVAVLEFNFVAGGLCFKKLCVDAAGQLMRLTPCFNARTECIATCDMGECIELPESDLGDLPDLDDYDGGLTPGDGGTGIDADDDDDGGLDGGSGDADVETGPPPECGTGLAACDDGDPCTVDTCTSLGQCDFRAMCPDTDASDCIVPTCVVRATGAVCEPQPAADSSTCSDGMCCAGECVDQTSDESNCGACGTACESGSTCGASGCACDEGRLDCDPEIDGCETDPLFDEAHCGAGAGCTGGVDCTAMGMSCINGVCGTCESSAECDDGLPCTMDVCSDDACTNTPMSGSCLIGGQCYDEGEQAASQCRVCNPALSTTAFSANPGAACTDTSFCTVSEVCGAMAGQCTSSARDCGDGFSCTTDACDESGDRCTNAIAAGSCIDDDTCVTTSFADPARPCLQCLGGSYLTPKSSGTSCADGEYCDGTERCNATGSCVAGTAVSCADSYGCTDDTSACNESTDMCTTSAARPIVSDRCFISGMCFNDNDSMGVTGSPRCKICDDERDQDSFSNAPDGTTCGAGMVCQAGTCVSSGSSCGMCEYDPGPPAECGCGSPANCTQVGYEDPTNDCRYCAAGAMWMYAPYGSSCYSSGSGDGQCDGVGNCIESCYGCMYMGSCIPQGSSHPTNPCQTCWGGTFTDDYLEGCGANGYCSAGTCVQCTAGACRLDMYDGCGCDMGGTCVMPGENGGPSDECRYCSAPGMITNVGSGQPCPTGTCNGAGTCVSGGFDGGFDGPSCTGCPMGGGTCGCYQEYSPGSCYAVGTNDPSNSCKTCGGTAMNPYPYPRSGSCSSPPGGFCMAGYCSSFDSGVFDGGGVPDSTIPDAFVFD